MSAELSGSDQDYWNEYYKNKKIVSVGSVEGASESVVVGDIANRFARVGQTLFRRTFSKSVSADELVKEGPPLARKSSTHHKQRARKWFRQHRYKILRKRKQFRKSSLHRLELKKKVNTSFDRHDLIRYFIYN